MPRKNNETKRDKKKKKKKENKKKLSKKKEKQHEKRKKLQQKKSKIIPEKKFQDLKKVYLSIALMNISMLLAEQGDLTWGGIVDPVTYQVTEYYWPGTDIPINEIDRSRINMMSSNLITGDPTFDRQKLFNLLPFNK